MESIIRNLIEDIMAFAYCDESEVSGDFSVAQLERIAAALGSAGQAELSSFLSVARRMAEESRVLGDMERAKRLESMPSHLGLVG